MGPNEYTDDELAAMMTAAESDLVERKQSLSGNATEKVSRGICAFANDLPNHGSAGVVLIGVTDDGRCAGLNVDDRLLKRLADLRDDGRTLPLPSMDVQRRTLDGCEVAVVTVQPAAEPPVRFEGRVWVRVGPTVRLASPGDERRLAERRRSTDIPFDLRASLSAHIDDLDLDHIERQYLPRAISSDVLDENQRTLGEQLHSLRLSDGEHPTNGALVAFARDPLRWSPGAYVQFVRFDGDEITDPILSQSVLSGSLADVLSSVSKIIELNIQTRMEIASSARDQRFPDYPVEALRQFAYNAVMHRNYEGTHAPTRLYWYRNSVAIESPGGLFGAVTAENIGGGSTDYRNKLIAETMHNLGFAQRFGYGIPAAKRTLEANGNPAPEFTIESDRVIVTTRPAA